MPPSQPADSLTARGPARGSPLVDAAMCVLVASMVVFLSWRSERDFDIFWHLRNGDVIAAAGGIPPHDVFSFTVPNAKFEAPDWLSDVLLARVFRFGGWPALQVWKLACLGAAVLMLRRAAAVKGADPSIAWACVALGLVGGEFRFLLRPLMFQFVFVAATVLNLESWRRDRRWWRLAILPVAGAAWINLHSSYVLAVLVPLCFLGADVAEWIVGSSAENTARTSPPKRTTIGLACAIGLTALAFGLNPGGFTQLVYLNRWTSQEVMGSVINENLPTDLAALASGGVGVSVAMVLASFLLARRRAEWVDLALLVLFAALGLKYRRFVALWCLALSPAVARNLTVSLAQRMRGDGVRVVGALGLVAVASFSFLGRLSSPTSLLTADPTPDRHPVGAVDWLTNHRVTGNVFNNFSFGGYILWRGYPDLKVFIDGRGMVYDQFMTKYHQVVTDERVLLEADDQFRFDAVVFARNSDFVLETLAASNRFGLVYWDDTSTVWLRRSPQFVPLLERYGYSSSFKPWRLDEMLALPASESTRRDATRSIEESPQAVMAWVFAAERAAREAGLSEAIRLADRGLAFHPDDPVALNEKGSLLSRAGDAKGARDVFARVVELDPGLAKAWLQLGQQHYRLGDLDAADAAWSRAARLAPDDGEARGKLAQLRSSRPR